MTPKELSTLRRYAMKLAKDPDDRDELVFFSLARIPAPGQEINYRFTGKPYETAGKGSRTLFPWGSIEW